MPTVPGSAPSSQIAQFRSDGVTASTGLRVPFFSDGFSRAYGLPQTHLVNLITEATPLREERPYTALVGLREVHYTRPALAAGSSLGAGPIRGVFRAPPIFGGGLFAVSGTTAFNVTPGVSCGTIPGAGAVRWAASDGQMVLVAGGQAFLFDGAIFNPIVNPVLPPVSDVAWLRGRFVYLAAGSGMFWYSEINDAANVTGLDFATAESAADPNVAVGVLNDELVFFGRQSVEFWSVSADASAPFQPNVGRGFQRGCAAQGSVAFADNALFWVGDNRVVYRVGNAPQRVSSNSIEDRLRQCATPADITAWTATFEGHELYVLTAPGVGTYAYDISRVGTAAGAYGDSYQRGEWAEWRSWGRPVFRGWCAAVVDDVTWLGDDTTGDLWPLRTGLWTDAGGPLTRMASAFIKVEEGTPRCNNLVLHGAMGVGNAVDPGARPVVEMRYSDDQGRTFSDWRKAGLGRAGRYQTRAFWQRLGCMRAPGRLVEIRCSDPVNVVFSHLELNAARPAT